MVGVVTRNEPEVGWSEFDLACYEVKDVTGRAVEPVADAVNTISAFADNAAAEGNPDVVPVDEHGERATREQPFFDWDYVCPTHEGYRAGVLEMVDDAVAVSPDVRVDDIGFPRAGYCHCERCDGRFAASEFEDRGSWRAAVVTEFVEDVRERVPGDLYLAVHPDPYPGHLHERSGVDLDALQAHVDTFVAPLYDTAYGTTYWLEAIASGFADRLDADLAVELYAVDVDLDALIGAAEVAEAYADDVFFGYDASTARAAVRRMAADRQDGVSHGPEE